MKMSTDPTAAELWESDADYGIFAYFYLLKSNILLLFIIILLMMCYILFEGDP